VNAQRAMTAGSRAAPRVAWLLCGLSLVLIAGAVAFAFLNRGPFWESVRLLALVSSALVGGMVALRRPANPVGWFLLVSATCFAIVVFTERYAKYGLLTEPGSLPLAKAMAWPPQWLWVPGAVLMLVFLPLYFPDGWLISRRWKWVVRFAAFLSVFNAVFSAFQPGDVQGTGLVNPMGVEALGTLPWVIDAVQLPLWLGLLLVSAASLVVRFRRSGIEQRQQIKWLAFAASAIPVWFIASPLVQETVPVLFEIGETLAFAGVPVAVGIAVLKYRLYDIDLVINRALVYGALTACVVGIYVLVVGYLGALLRTDDLLVSLIATGVVAVLFAPLRDRLQRIVNRLLYGERDDPYAALSRLGQRLEAALTPEAVLPTVAQTVKEALRLPYAAVEFGRNGSFEVAAETGGPVGDTTSLPLLYGGEPVGRLVLGRRPGEADFTPADRRLLEDLARQVGVAVHATRLTEEALRLSADLQKSRKRLVSTREEERRRLRRDLHDGLGPQLASLTMKAEAARDFLESAPDRSSALLEEITTQAQEAVKDVRRLVYGLRPPALDDLGLLGALQAQATHTEHNGLRLTVEVPEELPPLPAAVEVAVYRIAQEALTNAARHAAAQNCTVRIAPDKKANVLRLEVTDDGRGILEDRSAGVGLASMRERAEELGGTCEIETPSSGGTSVRAILPLVRGAEEGKVVEPGVRVV
jgi:signal transduction histidine kinase